MKYFKSKRKRNINSSKIIRNVATLEDLSKKYKIVEKELDKLKQKLLKNYKKLCLMQLNQIIFSLKINFFLKGFSKRIVSSLFGLVEMLDIFTPQ